MFSPKPLSHPVHKLVRDIELSIFAGLTKHQASHICLLQHLCQLTVTYSYKSNRYRYNALRTAILKGKQFFHVYKVCFILFFPFLQEVPMSPSLYKRQNWIKHTFFQLTIPYFLHQCKLLFMAKTDPSIHIFHCIFPMESYQILSLILSAWCPGNFLSTVSTMCIPKAFPYSVCPP